MKINIIKTELPGIMTKRETINIVKSITDWKSFLLDNKQHLNLDDNFEPKKYILRKIDTNISDIDIAKDKINKKKTQEAADDDW